MKVLGCICSQITCSSKSIANGIGLNIESNESLFLNRMFMDGSSEPEKAVLITTSRLIEGAIPSLHQCGHQGDSNKDPSVKGYDCKIISL